MPAWPVRLESWLTPPQLLQHRQHLIVAGRLGIMRFGADVGSQLLNAITSPN